MASYHQTRSKDVRRLRRKRSIRKKVLGSQERPRLSIYRSLNHIYAQVIDDMSGRTLAAAGSVEKDLRGAEKGTGNVLAATAIGSLIAERAIKAGVKKVVFDRNGFIYHGRVKALADAARKAGLEF
jgi:large subunit ribosomal protein L18